MTERLVGWTQADIDAALTVVRARQFAATAAGDLPGAAKHEGWMNRLLDARKHHRANRRTES